MNKRIIQVTILDDGRRGKCEAQCGIDWSSAEAAASADQQIEERFGGGVKLEYLDPAQLMADHPALELARGGGGENLPLPLLISEGMPEIDGQFDTRQLLEVIDTEVEIKYER